MVVAWVLQDERVCALLLPSASDESAWDELDVRPSQQVEGFGLYPASRGNIDWSNLNGIRVTIPYLGVETVVQDQHALSSLRKVLAGQFALTTLGAGKVLFLYRMCVSFQDYPF